MMSEVHYSNPAVRMLPALSQEILGFWRITAAARISGSAVISWNEPEEVLWQHCQPFVRGGSFLHFLILGICSWVLVLMTLRFGDSSAWTCLCFWAGSLTRRYCLLLSSVWEVHSAPFVQWKGSAPALCVVMEWEGLSFFPCFESNCLARNAVMR